ncbi:MAG: tetratricopeptide repeat protein [Luteolibacter sp.]
MHINFCRLAAACLTLATARADEPPLRDLLRDGLYAEEVTRDVETASKSYEQVLARYSEQRAFAASALFRLAEVRRKQDRKDDAIQLYQRLLAEFPGVAVETKLARENLAALGGKPAESAPVQGDEESKQLAELRAAAQSSPDVLLHPQTLDDAVLRGHVEVAKFLLAAGSPRYEGKALQNAAETGNLEIIKLLLASGGPVPEKVATEAIMKAIDFRRHTALEFMLKAGLKPGRLDHDSTVLSEVLIAEPVNWAAVDILLKNGLSIDEIVDPPELRWDSAGTALGKMVLEGRFESAAGLLERGANPNIPDLFWGHTPLHYAAARGRTPGILEMMEKLIDGGADLNQVSLGNIESEDHAECHGSNVTPIESAIGSETFVLEKTKLLLKHGAKLDRKDSRVADMLIYQITTSKTDIPELVKLLGEAGFRMDSERLLKTVLAGKNPKILPLLLKYGANPNVIGSKDPLLLEAARELQVEEVKMLLDGGADLKFQDIGNTILWQAARNGISSEGAEEQTIECLKLLLAAGASPPEGSWLKSGFNDVKPKIQRYLTEQFIIPNLIGGSDITLAADTGGGINPIKLATRQDGGEVPDLASWLWTNQSRISFIRSTSDTSNYKWSIRRKGADGMVSILEFDFHGSAPFPQLQWGDLVEFELMNRGRNIEYARGFTPEMHWSLRKRISFSVTAEIEGKSREIKVRGDRVIFDPTLNEVPLCDAQTLVQWLWPQPAQGETHRTTILATRKGWPEVRLAYGSQEANKFELQAGDHLKLLVPSETREALAKLRRSTVALTVPGLPFRRDFGALSDGVLLAGSLPTLVQAITDVQVPDRNLWRDWAGHTALGLSDLINSVGIFSNFTLLPHPDLGRIHIRRLQEDGSEKVIHVDLAKAISQASPDMSPEVARKGDLILQVGDIVEIQLKASASAGPWKGFTPEEERFFGKVLSGKVQLTDEQGNVTFTEIDYRAARFIETEVGLLPVPAASGVPSVRSWWITNREGGSIWREGVAVRQIDQSSAPGPFLRGGDEHRGGSGGRQPRPRVVPPPPVPPPASFR